MLMEIPNREGSVIPPVGDESLLPPSLSRFSEQGQEYKHYIILQSGPLLLSNYHLF